MSRKLPYKDYDGDMAKAQLQKIETYAAKLNEMIHPEDELEAWVQAKLSVVAAYMGDIKHYLDYQLKKSEESFDIEKWKKEVIAGADPYEDGGTISMYKVQPTTLEEDMAEARELVGVAIWDDLSEQDRIDLTKHLKIKGDVGHFGEELDIYTISSMQYGEGGEIEITKEDGNISVYYLNGQCELTGSLIPYHTGRVTQYEFHPSWFSDEVSEEIWNENWESIEEEILNQFNSVVTEYSKMASGGKAMKYGGFINRDEMSANEKDSYTKAISKGVSVIGYDGITFGINNEYLAQNLAKAFGDVGYDTKVVKGAIKYGVWVKQ